ncbi:MAG: hypothetical protein H6Q30_1333 [Bacteroidetes bacterium]|jgi:hypothetical protein|nr:hypothetical protein [Bacteroidota bacterium]
MNAGTAKVRSSSVAVIFPSVSICGNEKPRPSEGKTGAHATHAHNLHSFPRRYKGMRFWQVSWLMVVACPSPSHGLEPQWQTNRIPSTVAGQLPV